jgi:hypothetical protein
MAVVRSKEVYSLYFSFLLCLLYKELGDSNMDEFLLLGAVFQRVRSICMSLLRVVTLASFYSSFVPPLLTSCGGCGLPRDITIIIHTYTCI